MIPREQAAEDPPVVVMNLLWYEPAFLKYVACASMASSVLRSGWPVPQVIAGIQEQKETETQLVPWQVLVGMKYSSLSVFKRIMNDTQGYGRCHRSRAAALADTLVVLAIARK